MQTKEIEVLKAKLAAAEKILKQVKAEIESGCYVDMFDDVGFAIEVTAVADIEFAINEYLKGDQDAS